MDGIKVRAPRARTVKLAVAIFLTTAAMVVAVMMATSLVADAQESGASTGGADSDGYVPVSSVCFGGAQYATTDQYSSEQQYATDQYATDQYAGAQYATDQYSSEQLGSYSWYNDGYATYGTITIDDCALDAMGAGPEDRERVLAHERGHANGLLHSADPNDLMNPVVPIMGT